MKKFFLIILLFLGLTSISNTASTESTNLSNSSETGRVVETPFEGVNKPKIYRNDKISPFDDLIHGYSVNALPGRIQVISDPDENPKNFVRLTLHDGDCGQFLYNPDDFNDCGFGDQTNYAKVEDSQYSNDRVTLESGNFMSRGGRTKEGVTYYFGVKIRPDRDSLEEVKNYHLPVSTNLFELKHVNVSRIFSIYHANRYHDYYTFPERDKDVLYLETHIGYREIGNYCVLGPNNLKDAVRTVVARGPFGEWIEFVMKVKFSTRDDGFFAMWANGKQVYEHRGKNLCILPGTPESEIPKVVDHMIHIYKANMQGPKYIEEPPEVFPTVVVDFAHVVRTTNFSDIDKYFSVLNEVQTLQRSEVPVVDYRKNDGCRTGYIREDRYCVFSNSQLNPEPVSNEYDGQYTMYLYRSYPGSNDKNIVNAIIEIKGGFVKVIDNSDRWIHRKIDDPLDSLKGEVDTEGNLNWSMEIDPWKKSQFIHKVIFGGILNNDEPITGKYDEGTALRIELKKKD